MKLAPAEETSLTVRIVDFAIGDVITSFPALYQLAREKHLRLWFEHPGIRSLWAGPPVEMLTDPPTEGKSYDIRAAAESLSNGGLHMIQSWFWNFELPIPAIIPKISLGGDMVAPEDALDVIISPYSATGLSISPDDLRIWPFDRWNIVIDTLLGAGLSVGVCGVFREGASKRSFDVPFWGERPVRVLDSLPLIELAGCLRAARCVATVDNGISHFAHILGVPHAQLIPVGTGFPPSWIADHNPRAAWIYEPFRALPGRNDVLQPERVLELIFAVLSGFNKEAYIAPHPDLREAFGNSPAAVAWGHWVRYGQHERRTLGFVPRRINFGAAWENSSAQAQGWRQTQQPEKPASENAAIIAFDPNDLYNKFSDSMNRVASPIMLEHRPDFHKDFGKAPWYQELYDGWVKYNEHNNSGDMARFYALCLNLNQINDEGIPGAFVELGVYKGNSAKIIAKFAGFYGRETFLFDTFTGFDQRSTSEIDQSLPDAFKDTSLELVQSLVGIENITYVAGFFPDSTQFMTMPNEIAFAHIDCDLYKPAKSALEIFYPRLSPGGMIMMHDYGSGHWRGIREAVDGFFKNFPEKPVLIPDKCGTAIIRKFGSA